MRLSPEHFESLRSTVAAPEQKAALILGSETEVMATVLGAIFSLVDIVNENPSLGEFVVRFVPDYSGGEFMVPDLLQRCCNEDTRVLAVGDDGSVVSATTGAVDVSMVSEESKVDQCLCAFVDSVEGVVFANGTLIVIKRPSRPDNQFPICPPRSWVDLDKAFDDHFASRIDLQRGLTYWKNRATRSLAVGPKGTEYIFQHDLVWWFDNFIHDALDVYAEPTGVGQDKTDIAIVTQVGTIVIEVKWLGTNENGTTYGEIRITEGLVQVDEYLTRNEKFNKGYLVIYDGRTKNDHNNSSNYDVAVKHERCEPPVIFFLQNETPSEKGVRVAREMRTESDKSNE